MKRLLAYTLALVILIAFAITAWPSNGKAEPAEPNRTFADKAFKEAAVLYGEGRYDEAIARYEDILKKGYDSGNLYYNIGNCYLKKGMPGKAVLYYERARRLIPTDADLAANYDYARSFLRESPGEAVQAGMFSRVSRLFRPFTTNGLTVLASVLYVLVMALLILRIYFRGPAQKYTLPLIVLLMVLLLSSGAVLYGRVSLEGREAIVITDNVDARFEPFDKATVHYTISEGSKVEILQSTRDWYKIQRPDGKTGWVAKQNMEIL